MPYDRRDKHSSFLFRIKKDFDSDPEENSKQ